MDRRAVTQNSKDCTWALGLNRTLLNLIGIWPKDESRLAHHFRTLRAPLMLVWIVLAFLLPQMHALIKVYPDLTLLIDNFITSCSGVLALAKLFLIWYNRKVFKPLIHWMTSDWMREKASWERELMMKHAERGRLFTIGVYGVMVSTASSINFSPLVGLKMRIVNNITDLHERGFFPTQSYYPYNFTKSPNFELTYASQVVALTFAGASFSAIDGFFGILVFHAAGQCEILSVRFARLFDTEIASFKANLCRVVRNHVYLIRFVATIEKSFNVIVLCLVFGLSIPMCCVGFSVINSFDSGTENSAPPITQTIMLATALINTMTHILIYCMTSELLTSQSENLMQATYNSDWHSFPTKYSRDVVYVMMRLQYPLRLSVGKFFYLSLNFYAKILKTAAGFVSMLLTVR